MNNSTKRLNCIYFDKEHNQYYIIAASGEYYKIYSNGKKYPKWVQNYSGFVSGEERKKKDDLNMPNLSPDLSFYHGIGTFVDGYFQYPRPLVRPFSNISPNESFKTIVKNIFENESIIANNKNKKLINVHNRFTLDYMTSTFSQNKDIYKKDLISCISNEIKKNNKILEKYNNGLYTKGQVIKLKNLKSKLKSNSYNKVYNQIMPYPDNKFVSQFIINKNLIKNKKKFTKTRNKSMDNILESNSVVYNKKKDDNLYYCIYYYYY